MSNKKQRLRRRNRLWREDPRCRKCGKPTVLPSALGITGGKQPHNLATLQHFDDRHTALRGDFAGEERTTLWCFECNKRDNEMRLAALPLEVRQTRARLGHVRKKGQCRRELFPVL